MLYEPRKFHRLDQSKMVRMGQVMIKMWHKKKISVTGNLMKIQKATLQTF